MITDLGLERLAQITEMKHLELRRAAFHTSITCPSCILLIGAFS